MVDLITALTSTTSGTGTASMTDMLITFVPLILVFVLFYFILIRPQKKKEKQDAEMRKNIQVGDEVVTAGGIVGIVFSVKEDTVVVETGGDRSKIRVKKWAIAQNLTVHDDVAQ